MNRACRGCADLGALDGEATENDGIAGIAGEGDPIGNVTGRLDLI